jgi:bifunctional non-homologous end joining protein LigD
LALLQQDLGGRRATRAAHNAVLYAFDLLYFDGHDLTGLELSSRRHLLETLLEGETGAIRLSEEIETDDGTALLRSAFREVTDHSEVYQLSAPTKN